MDESFRSWQLVPSPKADITNEGNNFLTFFGTELLEKIKKPLKTNRDLKTLS
jgi:hypothetical protein